MMSQRRSERERYWREVMREQRASGMSVAAFCRERGVSVTSLYKWRGKLKLRSTIDPTTDRGELAIDGPVREVAMRNGEPTETTLAKFVPVELPLPSTAKRTGCEVVLPDGCRIIVSTQCDASRLREILEVLQGRAC